MIGHGKSRFHVRKFQRSRKQKHKVGDALIVIRFTQILLLTICFQTVPHFNEIRRNRN